MTTHTAVKTSQWIERARALAPVVEQWRDAGEQVVSPQKFVAKNPCHDGLP